MKKLATLLLAVVATGILITGCQKKQEPAAPPPADVTQPETGAEAAE